MADPTTTEVMAARVRVPSHVVYRAFLEETVVLNVERGTYHGLNATAGRMLAALETAPTAAAAAAALAAEYGRPEDEVAQDLARLCTGLAERGLVVLEAPDGG